MIITTMIIINGVRIRISGDMTHPVIRISQFPSTTLRTTDYLRCRTKLENLECLKNCGITSDSNRLGSLTTNDSPLSRSSAQPQISGDVDVSIIAHVSEDGCYSSGVGYWPYPGRDRRKETTKEGVCKQCSVSGIVVDCRIQFLLATIIV